MCILLKLMNGECSFDRFRSRLRWSVQPDRYNPMFPAKHHTEITTHCMWSDLVLI